MFDRLTILQLKHDNIVESAAQANVARELRRVEAVVGDRTRFPSGLDVLVQELASVNAALWRIEDDIRGCERAQCFDTAFVALARSVYRQNDRRAELKQRISRLLGSALIEEKSYPATGLRAGPIVG